MPVEVRIPTVLRPYTGDQKSVEANGESLSALIDDLDAHHPGIKERLVENGDLRRFVNVYVNDEDVRFLGGLEAPVTDGDQVVVLPAVAGGGLEGLDHP
jgi:molybdopterin synthase sulfur carrier subunit